MKVDAHQTPDATASAVGQSTASHGVRGGDADRKSGANSLSQDRLELSGLISDIAQAGAAGAARRAEQVEALTKLHRAGGYVPEPGALARKLIQQALVPPEGESEIG
jgi:hypothetical protein